MLANTTRLVAKIDPLKYFLSKAALTGRLAKWVMVLSEFDIQYVERKAIKGQVIADQLADRSQPFTKTLHKGVKYNWSQDCEQNLQQIK